MQSFQAGPVLPEKPPAAAVTEEDLSFAEEQLWLAEQAAATRVPFLDCTQNLSVVARLENTLDHDALKASLDAILQRHDVLRSRFIVRQGRPVRLVDESTEAALATVDLRQGCQRDREALLRDVLDDHVNRPFDLTRGPILRSLLVALAENEHILAMTAHHIVFDRWSKRVLARELEQLYEAYATGRTPTLEPLRAAYSDYVRWQRRRLAGEYGRQLVDHWTTKLEGLPDFSLAPEVNREQLVSDRAGEWFFTIADRDATRLVMTARKSRITPATLMLAILTLHLRRVSGHDDIAVGVPLSDRRHPNFEPLIGLFANVVVVRTRIAAATFAELLDRVRCALVDACRFQDMPYGHLVRIVGAQRPLYRVLFNFLPHIPESDLRLRGLRISPVPVTVVEHSRADLSLQVRQEPDQLVCRLVYKADLLSSAWVEAFAVHYRQLLTAVLDDPQQNVDSHTVTA
jgi:hypothetical protein